jgi:hypothetical protein
MGLINTGGDHFVLTQTPSELLAEIQEAARHVEFDPLLYSGDRAPRALWSGYQGSGWDVRPRERDAAKTLRICAGEFERVYAELRDLREGIATHQGNSVVMAGPSESAVEFISRMLGEKVPERQSQELVELGAEDLFGLPSTYVVDRSETELLMLQVRDVTYRTIAKAGDQEVIAEAAAQMFAARR